MLLTALALGGPAATSASAETFTDPAGDNIGLDSFGRTVTAPDMTFASQQILPDGRIELISTAGPGVCSTLLPEGGTADKPAHAFIALYADKLDQYIHDSINQADINYRIAFDTTRQSYVIRTQFQVVSVIDWVESGSTVVLRFPPRLIGAPLRLRWIASQHCRGDLPFDDVDVMPDTGYFELAVPPGPATPILTVPPLPQGTDPLPDAPIIADTSTEKTLSSAASATAKRLAKGIPATGLSLNLSRFAPGKVTVSIKRKVALARGTATVKNGRAAVRLRLTAAGRKALKGTGTLKLTMTIAFTPSAGGEQSTTTRQVTLARRS